MKSQLRQSVLALAATALLVSACNKAANTAANPSNTAAASAPAGSVDNPESVVARYNGKELKVKDVDAKIGEQIKELDKKKFQLRQQGAESMIIEELVKVEAAKTGQNEQEWLKANIDSKVPAPSEAEINKVFAENKDKMPPGSTLTSMRESIVNFIGQEPKRAVAAQIFDDLKKKSKFEMVLLEPKVQVEAAGPSKGANDAKVTIVEFSDFQCPFCSRAEPSVDEVMQKYAGKVRVVFRHFPLSFHENAAKAAEAAACADEQGKFWEMHKQLFANQNKLVLPELKEHAKTIGLDTAKFNECLDGGKMKAKVDADMEAGKKAGVNGTPAFFINGVMLSGAQPFAEFEKVINQELK